MIFWQLMYSFLFDSHAVFGGKWGNLCGSKVIGGGGGAPRATSASYSAKLCIKSL